MQVQTLKDFVQAAQACNSNDEMFELFEYNTADSVRDEVFAFADAGSAEPFRSAMHALGFLDF